MTKLIVDGTEIDVPPQYTLLQACEAAGTEIQMAKRPMALALRWLDDLREAMEEFRRALHNPLHRNGNRLDPNDPRWVTAFLVGVAIFLAGLVIAGALMVWLR